MKTFVHYIKQALLMLIAVQVMNLSIDVIEFRPLLPQVLSEVNESNSVTEFFAETIMGKKSAFPESGISKNHSRHQQLKNNYFAVSLPQKPIVFEYAVMNNHSNSNGFMLANLSFLPKDIVIPPPELI